MLASSRSKSTTSDGVSRVSMPSMGAAVADIPGVPPPYGAASDGAAPAEATIRRLTGAGCCAESALEDGDDVVVEAGVAPHQHQRRLRGQRRAVRTPEDEGVVHFRHGEHAGFRTDLIARQSPGIPHAVEPLVVQR